MSARLPAIARPSDERLDADLRVDPDDPADAAALW